MYTVHSFFKYTHTQNICLATSPNFITSIGTHNVNVHNEIHSFIYSLTKRTFRYLETKTKYLNLYAYTHKNNTYMCTIVYRCLYKTIIRNSINEHTVVVHHNYYYYLFRLYLINILHSFTLQTKYI